MPTAIFVRPAAAGDVPAFAAIEAHIAEQPWSEGQFLEELSLPHAALLCALWENTVIGYLDVHIVSGDAHINELGVSVDFRRRGAASALLNAACEHAENRGCRSVTLEVRSANSAARALYRKCGFKQLGIRKNLYTFPADDGVILIKELYQC